MMRWLCWALSLILLVGCGGAAAQTEDDDAGDPDEQGYYSQGLYGAERLFEPERYNEQGLFGSERVFDPDDYYGQGLYGAKSLFLNKAKDSPKEDEHGSP